MKRRETMQSQKFEFEFDQRLLGYALVGLALFFISPVLALLVAACYVFGCFPFSRHEAPIVAKRKNREHPEEVTV